MLQLLSFIVGLAVFGSGDAVTDPTTVCYPPALFAHYVNLITEDTGNVSYDFTQSLFVEASDKTGLRIVHDFKNLKVHAVMTIGNITTCRTSLLHPSAVMSQCLPTFAKEVPELNGNLGYYTLTGAYGITVQTWDVETEYDTVHRTTFRYVKSQPYYPVMSQELGYHGIQNMIMYLNPTYTISDKGVFELPGACNADSATVFPTIIG